MTAHPTVRGMWTFLLSTVLLAGSWTIVRGQEELPPEIDSDGVQTLTRGPVHEAFASPTIADPKPGLTVPKAPPADIREQPPEFQPEGQNVQWFSGYWAWDEDRDDYIWISGAWRDPPPGKRWVPGYWATVPGGFQWVAGFWIDEQVEEMEYLKPPPQSLEQGPSVAQPGDDYFYVPGNWAYVNNDYRWSAGYWAPYREDWVYVQPHWVWTPRGCIFVNGYWDWRVPQRGQIFAPIYVAPVVYHRPTFFYTPRCVINTSNLFVHLWVRDSYSHYYFGNYYGPTYAQRHFTPWCNYTSRPRCYDPLFSYCNVHYHRQGVNYAHRMQGWHNHYVNHVHERPANTWRDQVNRHRHDNDRDHDHRPANFANTRPAVLGHDLKDVIRNTDHNHKWKRQDVAGKDLNRQTIEQVKQLHKLRLDQEKVTHVSRDLPGRGSADRDNRPNRGNELGDRTKAPDLKLPGSNPADKIATAQQVLAGKIKLPKPTATSRLPGKTKIEVPDAPEKTAVSRPITRPNVLDKPVNVPARVPSLRNPAANIGPGPKLDGPANTGIDKPNLNQADTQPLTNRDPRINREPKIDPKKPLGGTTNSATNSPTNSLQQKIDAIRQQQQDALNKARNRSTEPIGPQLPNLGGNTNRKIETPRIETPKIQTPKIELQNRNSVPTTRPPLSSGSNSVPRNFGGGNLGGSLGGNTQPKINVPPRNLTPSVQPRSFTPAPQPRVQKPTIDRAPVQRPNLQVPQSAPRNLSVPRSNPQPRVPDLGGNSGGNNAGERKRGR